MIELTALNVYLIKACKGHSLDAAFVERMGLAHDRRLMIIRPNGTFVTQRDYSALALVLPDLRDSTLHVSAPGMPPTEFPVATTGVEMRVTVWEDSGVKAIDQGEPAAEWFSTYLRTPVRLVHMATDEQRRVNPKYAIQADDHVSFADGYPILIASQESLDELNRRLTEPLPMNRFRPNLVVRGCQPFEEDTWKRIRIGEVELALVKPCSRCEVTTIDQESAVRGKEPLKTLATFRRVQGNKVMFGMNVIPLNEGTLRVGESLEVLA